ncbi:hypothetical protein A3I55_05925 [Candidatus Woesebacteria bacterium RIFCSPLOWO2_02_FULL_42_10]|nr:MAG: hypothetical protein A3I55_05925 [Candidatus Woesebacteria bacterium RIFCSPLOWO2_02_FULL_42_10]
MEISIENTGNTAIYDRDLQILFDGKIVDFKKVPALLPFSKTTKLVDVPFSFFGNRTPETLTVAFGEDEKTILTYKSSLIIFSLLSSAVAIFIACGFVVWLIKAK